MTETGWESLRSARWIICESTMRWSMAVKRFAPALVPPHGIPVTVAGSAQEVLSLLTGLGPRIVLWDVQPQALVTASERLIQAARTDPHSLQLVAGPGLLSHHLLALSELPVHAFLRHPEELPRLKPMIEGYLTRSLV